MDTIAFMPHWFRILPERQMAVFHFSGPLTVEEGADLFLSYVAAPGFDPDHTMLCDARAITEVHASFLSIFSRMMRLAPQLRLFRTSVASVVLVQDQTVFGYVRMLEQLLDITSKIRMIPAWSEDEALSLVGRPDCGFAALFRQP